MTQQEIQDALGQVFDPSEVKWKPQAVKGDRAMAIAYVDARVIQDRLDDVLGVAGWKDEYDVLPDGSVCCRLSLRIEGEWILKSDVGSQSEQPDGGDRMKSAYSDALKRAAVKFGIGRYLYRLPQQWVPYDAQKRRLVQTPTLPPWAMPQQAKPAPKPQPAKPVAQATPDDPNAGAITVEEVLECLHARNKDWASVVRDHHTWLGDLIGRAVSPDMRVQELTQSERQTLTDWLVSTARKKKAGAA